MPSIPKIRQTWLRYHLSYEKRAYTVFKAVFVKWTKAIQWQDITEDNYKTVIADATNDEDMWTAYLKVYTAIGLVHGPRVGRSLNKELRQQKEWTLEKFLEWFSRDMPHYLRDNVWRRIVLVDRTYQEDVFKLFETRLREGKTLRDTTTEIYNIMNKPSFYRWQAQRIARTETTGAANYATMVTGQTSGYAMNKRWISALDNRTRRRPPSDFDHATMNGKVTALNMPFVFNEGTGQADPLLYPGDVNGMAGNVINCRCTIALQPQKDKNGRLIRLS